MFSNHSRSSTLNLRVFEDELPGKMLQLVDMIILPLADGGIEGCDRI
jgi:hypothetical protein